MNTESITWNPVTESLPDAELTVLIYCPEADEPVWPGYYTEEGWFWADGGHPQVTPTHWAPFPEGPAA